MQVASVALGTIVDWAPGPGTVVSWHPSPAALEKARQAPVSAVPPSYMQAGHLRGFSEYAAQGLDYSRLFIGSCDVAGRCDIRTMSYVINAHVRRHDTYRSWFEYQNAETIIRHTIADPGDIKFVPTKHGEMTPTEFRDLVLATPDPLHWDCFSFGVMQRADHFNFYMSVDHIHMDAKFVGVILMELILMYAALVEGEAPIPLPESGSYDDYCVRQHRDTSVLTLETPEVQRWIQFAENNNGAFPDLPLPLGDPSLPCSGDLIAVELMNDQQTAQFESACVESGARFVGGVFACAALAEYELTGAQTYYGLSTADTRTPEELMTLGWFTGLVPVVVPIATTSFGDAARAAQASFDSNTPLANVPFDRVLELAPWLNRPRPNFPQVNYYDAGAIPTFLTPEFAGLSMGMYFDGRLSLPLCMWVARLEKATELVVLFPNNPIARESVTRYAAAMKSVYVRVAEGRDVLAPVRNVPRA